MLGVVALSQLVCQLELSSLRAPYPHTSSIVIMSPQLKTSTLKVDVTHHSTIALNFPDTHFSPLRSWPISDPNPHINKYNQLT